MQASLRKSAGVGLFLKKMKKFLIGIDPSFKTAGVAFFEPGSKKYDLFTGDFLGAVAWLNSKPLRECIAVLENPALDSTLFFGWSKVRGSILKLQARAGTLADVESEFRVCTKMAMHVGQSQAAGEMFKTLFEQVKVPCVEIAPSARHRADKPDLKKLGIEMFVMPTKTTAEQFRQLTGHVGRSSEHARDAATLVWGKTVRWAEMQIQIQKNKGGE